METWITSQKLAAFQSIAKRCGLQLTAAQLASLEEDRTRVLRDTGRIEWDGGILLHLAEYFCDSPYLQQEAYADTLGDLQELFYHLKNEAGDLVPDSTVLKLLRRSYDRAGGSCEYLRGHSLKELQIWLKEDGYV